MSKIAITGNASGTGTFTIASPNSNSDRTLNLPDSAGTLATAESTLTQFSASGSAPVFAARAWVNFDGTTATPSTIRASGNVSSVTRNSTGVYTINFATAMQDANYGFSSGITNDDPGYFWLVENPNGGTYSSTALQIRIATQSGSTTLFARNSPRVLVQIFR